jgi:hypothetical protein
MVAPPGNQAENGENKPQPVALEETSLLDSLIKKFFFCWHKRPSLFFVFNLKICAFGIMMNEKLGYRELNAFWFGFGTKI